VLPFDGRFAILWHISSAISWIKQDMSGRKKIAPSKVVYQYFPVNSYLIKERENGNKNV
jgi:hypothetical protein